MAFGEYATLWHDIRHAHGARTKLALVFRGPGWRPAGEDELSEPVQG